MLNLIKENAGWIALVVIAILFVTGAFWGKSVVQNVTQSSSLGTACSGINCLSGGLRLVSDTGGQFEADIAAVFSSTFTLGSSGTSLAGIKTGACTIWTNATTIVGTTTQQIVCQGGTTGSITAISGITADSVCNLTMASSTNTTLGGLMVEGSSASSTAGTIVARLLNLTGATFTWNAAASSSSQWNYTCFDPS